MTIFSSRNCIAVVAVFAAHIFSPAAFAANFDFDATYDGISASWDGVGDNPIGTSLMAGDEFNYNLHAAGDDYWSVDVGTSYFPLLAFTISEGGDRTGNMTLSFFLDGVQQGSSVVENGIVNSTVHLGTNAIVMSVGQLFDEIVIDYLLLSSLDLVDPFDPIAATINDFTIGPYVPGGFDEGISYVSAVSAVPVPAAVWLFGTALIGFVGMSRRRKVA